MKKSQMTSSRRQTPVWRRTKSGRSKTEFWNETVEVWDLKFRIFKMNCPYCDFSGHRMDIHAHLVDSHSEKVQIYQDDELGKMVYELDCPMCEEGVKAPISKRSAIPEYKREIRMVAFDLLLYHIQEIHEDDGSELLQIK